jgi:hypothetical protein
MNRYNNPQYAKSGTPATEGWPTDSSTVGPWILISGITAIGVQIIMPNGISSPTGSFICEVTDDEAAPATPDANLSPGISNVTPAAIAAVNPPGTDTAVNIHNTISPGPRAKWFRFRYAATSGGTAAQTLKVGINCHGPAS